MAFLLRLFICIALCGITLYAYVNRQNRLTALRMQLPMATKELMLADEENVRLQFVVTKFQNPTHLMELAVKPEYSHLHQPYLQDIILVDNTDYEQ